AAGKIVRGEKVERPGTDLVQARHAADLAAAGDGVIVGGVADDQPGGHRWIVGYDIGADIGNDVGGQDDSDWGHDIGQGDSRRAGGAVIKHGPLVIAVHQAAFPVGGVGVPPSIDAAIP